MRYYLYVIKSFKDRKLYVGVSRDPNNRLKEHNSGKNKSTKYRRPFVLLHTRGFDSKKETYKYEWFVKNTGEGNKSLKAELAKLVKAGA